MANKPCLKQKKVVEETKTAIPVVRKRLGEAVKELESQLVRPLLYSCIPYIGIRARISICIPPPSCQSIIHYQDRFYGDVPFRALSNDPALLQLFEVLFKVLFLLFVRAIAPAPAHFAFSMLHPRSAVPVPALGTEITFRPLPSTPRFPLRSPSFRPLPLSCTFPLSLYSTILEVCQERS
jgi:hypothetical protein